MKCKLIVKGDPTEIASSLFQEEGHTEKLGFLMTAVSTSACKREMVFEQPIEFRDYLMEGFIKFMIQVNEHKDGLVLIVEKLGSNRDQYLESHLNQNIAVFGYNVQNA